MATEQGLALRAPLTRTQLKQRIDVNVSSGWGLEKATQAQLNGLILYCERHNLLPGDEVTLYEGRPWKTLEGCVTLMRRNRDEYRGHAQRPLTREEKEAWGWDPEDIVVETTIRTQTYGEIKGHGRVSKEERHGTAVQGVRHNPVARHHSVEMAQKRSLQRTQRVAFGSENFVDDDELEEARFTIQEQRADPERQARLAADYQRIYEPNYADDVSDVAAPPDAAGEAASEFTPSGAAESPERQITSKTDPLWKAWLGAESRARQAGLEVETSGVRLPIVGTSLRGAIDDLLADVDQRIEQSQQAGQAQAF